MLIISPFLMNNQRFSELSYSRLNEDSIRLKTTNHLGEQVDYSILIKIRNQTQEGATQDFGSPVAVLTSFNKTLQNGEVWNLDLEYAENYSYLNDVCVINDLSINGQVYPLDLFSHWDSENDGFFFECIFELWIKENAESEFQYHNRYVAFWLKIQE